MRRADGWREWQSSKGERVVRATPGTLILVPAGCPHAFANPTDAPARMSFQSSPPPDHERYFEELLTILSADGPVDHEAIAALRRRLLGVPAAERPRLRTWADAVLTRARDEAEVERARQAKVDARAFFLELARQRRLQPQDDLISGLQAAVDSGKIEEGELLALVTLMALNGWHAVRNHTSNMVYCVLTDDSLMSRFRSDPDAVPAAVEELLRYIPHKHGVGQARIATEDLEVEGVFIRRGESVYVSYVAANWDEQHYLAPHRIDIDRQGPAPPGLRPRPHHCPAPLLARMEAELLPTTLLTRLPNLRLATDPRHVHMAKRRTHPRPGSTPGHLVSTQPTGQHRPWPAGDGDTTAPAHSPAGAALPGRRT